MVKIKVSKDVANFIDDYARNMSHDEDWKDKLLIDHSITYRRGFDGEFDRVRVLQDITPMKLAEVLHNGWEAEDRYDKDNVSKYLKVKHHESKGVYNIIINGDEAFVEFKRYNGKSDSMRYCLAEVLKYLNEEKWIVIQ